MPAREMVEIAKQVVEMQTWASGQLTKQNEGHLLWWRSTRIVLRRAFEVLMHDLRSTQMARDALRDRLNAAGGAGTGGDV